jgi:hypothetical protein
MFSMRLLMMQSMLMWTSPLSRHAQQKKIWQG